MHGQYGVGNPSPGGGVYYFDAGQNKKLLSVTIDAVVIVSASHAEIFGTGKVNGGPAQPFRVDITKSAAGDTFSIMWAGYAASGTIKGDADIDLESCQPEPDDGNNDNGGHHDDHHDDHHDKGHD